MMLRKTILTAAILSAGVFAATQAEATTLSFATNTTTKGLRAVAEQTLIDAIEQETGIKVKAFWGGSLAKGNEVLTALERGVADIGSIQINYHPNKLLLNSGLNLFPQGPQRFESVMKFYHKLFKEVPELRAEYTKFGQKTIYNYTLFPYAIAANKPISSLADLKGKKIRAASHWYLKLLADVGAIPVSVPFADCYMALQTGNIDAVFTNYDAIPRTKLDEPAPNLWIIKQWWTPAPYAVNISLAKWNKLSPDEQKGILRAGEVAEKKFGEKFASIFASTVAEQKKKGYKVAFASDEDVAAWMAVPAIEANRKEWIKSAKDLGVDDAEAVLNKIGALVAEAVAEERSAK